MCLAVPGRVESVEGDDPQLRTGRVSFGGAIRRINLSLVPEVKPGDYVLAHVGFALNIIDEAEALQTLEYLRQMADTEVPADQ